MLLLLSTKIGEIRRVLSIIYSRRHQHGKHSVTAKVTSFENVR